MPIYEYRCSKCGFQDEYLQKVSEPPLKVCPSCGKAKFEKLLSAPGFHLKGSGWYATDFKGGPKKEDKAKDDPAAAAAPAATDAKPADANTTKTAEPARAETAKAEPAKAVAAKPAAKPDAA